MTNAPPKKPAKRTATRTRLESSEEEATVPTRRVTSGRHARVASTSTTTAAVTSTKANSSRAQPFRTTSKARTAKIDEYELNAFDNEGDDQRSSQGAAPHPIVPRSNAPTTYKSVRGKKRVDIVPESSSSSDEEHLDEVYAKPNDLTSPKTTKPRPSMVNYASTPYVELTRRPSTAAGSPPKSSYTPSPTVPSPKTVPTETMASASAGRVGEPMRSTSSSRASVTPFIGNNFDPRIIAQVLQSDDYASLRTGLEESLTTIQSLKADIASERNRSSKLESEIEAERALAKARDEAIASRIGALETQSKLADTPLPNSTATSQPEHGQEEAREKLNQLEAAFKNYQRETDGVIASHKATVSALDQHTRTLEARLKKLELAAITPNGLKPVYEIGTPPAPRTGKRGHRDDEELEPDDDVEDGATRPNTNDQDAQGSLSTQPSPAKRPRFEDINRAESPSAFLQESLQNELQEEQQLKDLAVFAGGNHVDGTVDATTEAGLQREAQPSVPAHNSNGKATENLGNKSSSRGSSLEPAMSRAKTIDPAVLKSFSPRRPIAALRRSSTSKESTTPKLVRTSALSFGQALRPRASGADQSLSASTSASMLAGQGVSAGIDFGTPSSASTPAIHRQPIEQQPQASPDVSFGAGFQFRPSFAFGDGLQQPLFPPTSSTVPPAEKNSENAPENEEESSSRVGQNTPSSPAFPIDSQPRRSTDFDFGVGIGAGVENSDPSPPPSPTKRTMYGTELTTPMRQTFFGERIVGGSGSGSSPFGGSVQGVEVRERQRQRQRPLGFGLRAPAIMESNESMSLDETSTALGAGTALSGAIGNADIFGPPPPTADDPFHRAQTPPSATGEQLPNPSPVRYGLDDPMSWGPRPKRGTRGL